MQTKLTLTLNSVTIQKAKRFAKKSNKSLSEIIQSYLEKIIENDDYEKDFEIDQILGIIELPKDFDDKKYVREILTTRQSKRHFRIISK